MLQISYVCLLCRDWHLDQCEGTGPGAWVSRGQAETGVWAGVWRLPAQPQKAGRLGVRLQRGGRGLLQGGRAMWSRSVSQRTPLILAEERLLIFHINGCDALNLKKGIYTYTHMYTF